MKRAVIGGFFSLLGSIWMLAILSLTEGHLASAWASPPGRLLTTIAELHLTGFFVISAAFVILGVVLMAIEYFKKGE